jgi:hypothetical protein
MNKIKSTLKIVVIFLILIWIPFNGMRTMYNLSKIYTEEMAWIRLSDEEKREKLFEDRYIFIQMIDEETKISDSININSQDGMVYYLARYYLYPKKIYWNSQVRTNYYATFDKNNISESVMNRTVVRKVKGKEFKGVLYK